MYQKQFRAYTPFEVGDVVLDQSANKHIITDIATISYFTKREPEFMYELDHSGEFVTLDLTELIAKGLTDVRFPCGNGDPLYLLVRNEENQIQVDNSYEVGHVDSKGIYAYKAGAQAPEEGPYFIFWNSLNDLVFLTETAATARQKYLTSLDAVKECNNNV